MLLEGIELINKVEIMGENPKIKFIGYIVFVMMLVFLFIGLFLFDFDNKSRNICFGICILLAMVKILIFQTNNKFPTGEYYYEVILEDTVNLKEFYQKYEVIEIKGDLYTIKEKE